jgi:adenylate cyclase
MEPSDAPSFVMIADIVGSTALYATSGNRAAVSRVVTFLDGVRDIIARSGGEFIHSKGDDVLATFSDPEAAMSAAQAILASQTRDIEVRVGLNAGPVIRTRNDVFGDAVNIAARLASRANPGEVLVSDEVAILLSPPQRASLRALGEIHLKGVPTPQCVYRLASGSGGDETHFVPVPSAGNGATDAHHDVAVRLRHGATELHCSHGATITIGRSLECDLVIERQWISRQHAAIANLDGRPRLIERSSSGTFLSMGGEREIFIRREEVLLVGEGRISPGVSADDPSAEVISFEVLEHV